MQNVFIATVQIVIPGVVNESEACDWMSGLLSENPNVLDWQYVEQPKPLQVPSFYTEGDAFNLILFPHLGSPKPF